MSHLQAREMLRLYLTLGAAGMHRLDYFQHFTSIWIMKLFKRGKVLNQYLLFTKNATIEVTEKGVTPMAAQELKRLQSLIRGQVKENHSYSVQEVLNRTLAQDSNLYESDVKSALLSLVRQNELDLTDDFKVQLPQYASV